MKQFISLLMTAMLTVSLTACSGVPISGSKFPSDGEIDAGILNIHLSNYETEFNKDYPCDLYVYLDDVQIAIIPFGEFKCINDLKVVPGTHYVKVTKENDPNVGIDQGIIIEAENSTFYSDVANQRYNVVFTNLDFVQYEVSHSECQS